MSLMQVGTVVKHGLKRFQKQPHQVVKLNGMPVLGQPVEAESYLAETAALQDGVAENAERASLLKAISEIAEKTVENENVQTEVDKTAFLKAMSEIGEETAAKEHYKTAEEKAALLKVISDIAEETAQKAALLKATLLKTTATAEKAPMQDVAAQMVGNTAGATVQAAHAQPILGRVAHNLNNIFSKWVPGYADREAFSVENGTISQGGTATNAREEMRSEKLKEPSPLHGILDHVADGLNSILGKYVAPGAVQSFGVNGDAIMQA
jgi:hypothetical protein